MKDKMAKSGRKNMCAAFRARENRIKSLFSYNDTDLRRKYEM